MYIFNKITFLLKLNKKTNIGCFIKYKKRDQYYMKDLVCQAIFAEEDMIIQKTFILSKLYCLTFNKTSNSDNKRT